MVEFNDRRSGLHLFEPKPYFPHRGSPEKRAQGTQGKLFHENLGGGYRVNPEAQASGRSES